MARWGVGAEVKTTGSKNRATAGEYEGVGAGSREKNSIKAHRRLADGGGGG